MIFYVYDMFAAEVYGAEGPDALPRLPLVGVLDVSDQIAPLTFAVRTRLNEKMLEIK